MPRPAFVANGSFASQISLTFSSNHHARCHDSAPGRKFRPTESCDIPHSREDIDKQAAVSFVETLFRSLTWRGRKHNYHVMFPKAVAPPIAQPAGEVR
jgi:hypothetical protein